MKKEVQCFQEAECGGAPEQAFDSKLPLSPRPAVRVRWSLIRRSPLCLIRPLILFSVFTMEEEFSFPVYFDYPSLDEEQRKRIQKYFLIRRKSGGGDCGSVTQIKDKVYRISFKDKDGKT